MKYTSTLHLLRAPRATLKTLARSRILVAEMKSSRRGTSKFGVTLWFHTKTGDFRIFKFSSGMLLFKHQIADNSWNSWCSCCGCCCCCCFCSADCLCEMCRGGGGQHSNLLLSRRRVTIYCKIWQFSHFSMIALIGSDLRILTKNEYLPFYAPTPKAESNGLLLQCREKNISNLLIYHTVRLSAAAFRRQMSTQGVENWAILRKNENLPFYAP